MDVITALKTSNMNIGRWYAVFLCVLCNIIDGLDLLLASYALPHLPTAFATSAEKGLLISLGFTGMAFGSLFVVPFADRFGRKNLIVAGLLVCTFALAATAIAPGIQVMLVMRLLTGVAVGTVTPLSFVLADEYSSESRRSVSVGVVALGYPIGSTLGGMIGLVVISSFGGAWQALFWFGAVVSIAVLLIAWRSLPESLTFLVGRDPRGAEQRIARIVARMRLNGVDPTARPALADLASAQDKKNGVLSDRYRGRSWVIWVGYAASSTAAYFVSSWTPQLVTTASGSVATGTLLGTVVSVGTFAATILFTFLVLRVSPTKLCWIAGTIAVIAQVSFALTMANGAGIASAAVLGMSLQAVQCAYIASCARLYPTLIRARAEGLMMGFSRVGTILVPLLVGYVLSLISPQTMYLSASVFVVFAAGAAVVLWKTTKREIGAPGEMGVSNEGRLAQPATSESV